MKKNFKFFAFLLALVIGLTAIISIASLKTNDVVNAAEFTYQEGRDGFSYTPDGKLKVTFTIDSIEDGLSEGLINWAVYFIDPATGLEYNTTTHKYEDNSNRLRDVADYYFLINPDDGYNTNGDQVRIDSDETYTIYVDDNAVAYYATTSNPSSSTDMGTETEKTMIQAIMEKDWIIGVGPIYSNWWTSGYSAPIDYYVGRQGDLVFASTVYFRDFDGSLIDSEEYHIGSTATVDTSDVTFTPDSNKVFKGWYCDTTKELYTDLSAVQALYVSDIIGSTNTANFYATYQRGTGKYIEFTPVANYTGNYTQTTENDTILVEENVDNTTFTVTYKITHNDGVNSILLIPDYDKELFSITGITVDNTTALGTATLTYGEFDKILLESETTYGSLNNTFVTITFNMDKPVDGDYKFGFKLAPYIHNEVSEAYYWLDGTRTGEQEELEIVMKYTTESIVRVLTYKDAEITVNDNVFVYNGSAVTTDMVDSMSDTLAGLIVEYIYEGDASVQESDITINWYDATSYGEVVSKDLRNTAPVNSSDYYGYGMTNWGVNVYDSEYNFVFDDIKNELPFYVVEITAPARGMYHSVTKTARVYIKQAPATIIVDNKTSVYRAPLEALTFTAAQGLGASVSTTATQGSGVGTYPITASFTNANYYPANINNGTYTITPLAITITAGNQEAAYTGNEPTVSQSNYTVVYTQGGADASELANDIGVVLTKDAGVNVGTYPIRPSITSGNYALTAANGTFTITSVNLDLSQFFIGGTFEYDAYSHDLLALTNNAPEWLIGHYVAENNVQTHVSTTNEGKHTITVTIDLDAQTAANYAGGQQHTVLTVYGEITPHALTITADNKTSEYGATPVDLTPTTVNGLGSDVINVTFVTKNGDDVITITNETPVGTYAIVPGATNSDYIFTFVNGTYTITKPTVVITLSAGSVIYNRALEITHSAKVNNVTLSGYSVIVKNSDNQVVDTSTVLDAGDYTVTVTVAGTDDYNGDTKIANFTIIPAQLANIDVENIIYNKSTVTWDAVTTDFGGVELYNTTITYAIDGNPVTGLTYTATSAMSSPMLSAIPSNNNYLLVQTTLNSIYSVTFNDGTHTANPETPDNMPATQYLFGGETATAPVTNPTLTGYQFNAWDFDFDTEIEQNTTVVAIWNVNTYTVTIKYTSTANTENTDVFNFTYDYNSKVNYTELNLLPVKSSDNAGIYYTFNNELLNNSNSLNYIINANGYLENDNVEFIVTADATFICQYNTNYNSFTVTYYVSENGGDYVEYSTPTEVVYNTTIPYVNLATNIHWFKANAWYANEARTTAVPTKMPAQNINVYGAITFDIGQGDVNGDGSVDANDITLYRQWIVGGYDMTVVAIGEEWATAQNFDSEVNYFIARVADNNEDTSKDIRDISITRMSIVGGYNWDLETSYNVTGGELIRNIKAVTLNSLSDAITSGKKVTLTDDITEANGFINIVTNKNVTIDLNGHTLTVGYFTITAPGYTSITIKNGTIVTTTGVTISSASGDVILTDLTAYDENGVINLAAGSHSLHLNGAVAFRNGTILVSEPAEVKVEKDTHIVIEESTNIVIEKIIVTENFEPLATEEAVISIDNYSVLVEEIEVEGFVVSDNSIDSLEKLLTARDNGGIYVLDADISYSGQIAFNHDIVIDLNGHTLRSTNNVALSAVGGATLTLNGNGNVIAQEACVMAFDASKVVINGGTYTSYDNFVIGTNGTNGRGGNTITINGGTFNGNIQTAGYIACGVYVANNDTVTINAGTFTITNGVGILARSGNTTIGEDVVINVTGNGTLGKVGDSKVTVPTGNAIVLDKAAAYPGGVPTLTNNTEYTVYTKNTIGATADLSAAITNGGDYTLIADVTFSGQASFAHDTVIFLNGHTLRSTNNVALSATNGATLTINGNGNVIAQEACVMAFDASKVVINGGTYTSYDNFVIGTNGTNGRGENTITINGGTFNGNIQSTGYVACGVYVANSDTVTINAGTFTITNGVGILARSGNTTIGANVVINVTGNGTLGKVGDSKVTVPTGNAIVLDKAAGYPGGVPTLTNNTNYTVYTKNTMANTTDLNSAITNGGDYTLTADVVYNGQASFAHDTVIFLNGHTLRSTNDVALSARNGATLTINGNGNVIAQEACVMAFDASTVVINGGTYTSYDNFVIGTNGTAGKGENTIIINGGTFNGNIQTAGYIACGVYVANDDTVTINAGTFAITNGIGILARSGNTTIGANVVINATGNGSLGKVGDSRVVVPTGSALVIDYAAAYPGGIPTLTNNTEYEVVTID